MTDSTGSTLTQVTALDEERRRYEAWLIQLDERHGSTPERVLQRVRADYEERLRDVVARLGEHAELLQRTVADRARALDALRAEEQEHQDSRAEAELRAMVGEYTPEQWRELAARADEELAGLSQQRRAAEEELSRLEQVLALAHRADVAGAETEQFATPPADEEAVASAPTQEWPTAEGARSAAMPEAVTDGEPRSVVAPRASEVPPGGVAPAHVPSAADWFGESAAPAAAPVAPAVPAAGPAASAGPQAKTLRCQECGTMNYPTEWYCERCGGELATL